MGNWSKRPARARIVRALAVIAVAAATVAAVVATALASTQARGNAGAATPGTAHTLVANSTRLTADAVADVTGTSSQTVYSLVHGCYSLASPSGAPVAAADGPFTMQAAALGVYLLYTPRSQYLNAGNGGALTTSSTPSTLSEWQVTGSQANGFTLTNSPTGASMTVKFVPATGCAPYPEAGVDATGNSFTGASPEADVLGTVEGHSHIMAFEFFGGDWHCGRPWSPFGAPTALPASCASDEQGTNGTFEDALDNGRPKGFHGWPTFVGWPSPTALAEEGDYYTGIERAWKAGLRLMVSDDVDNEALCSLMTTKHNPCNDMQSAALQSQDLHELQDYIDAQSGGPGKGWFRLVTTPEQARQVINQGKLAVIQGIEVSALFNCTERNNVPSCSDQQIDDGIKQVESYGVRTFFPVHEFDNAFGGTKGIAGTTGLIVNAGNRDETGAFWDMKACDVADQDAEQTTAPDSGPFATLLDGPLATLLHGAPLPVYAPGPTCNTRGITDYGTYLIQQMVKNHIIIQLDHMDSKTAASALQIATADHYSGVTSAHCCNSPQLFKGIYSTGGIITEPAATATSFVATMKADEANADPKYKLGFGYGSDMNGLAEQPGPSPDTPITYPFKSYMGNVTFTQEQWGQRTFDLNTDGVANYGMYADWLNDIQHVGGAPVMNQMFQGAEAYLEMWERADGVPATSCAAPKARFTTTGLGKRWRLGDTEQSALMRGGQPSSRPGRSYRYCGGVSSVFGFNGKVQLIGATARGDRAGAFAPGMRARGLKSGVNVRGRYVYGVRGGKVAYVAVATKRIAGNAKALKADLAQAKLG